MEIKISLIVVLSFISLSELYAIKESSNIDNKSKQSHLSYTVSKNEKSIFQNLLFIKEAKQRVTKEPQLKDILPTDLQQAKYHKEKCHTPYRDKSSLPIGCIKIKIQTDIDRI